MPQRSTTRRQTGGPAPVLGLGRGGSALVTGASTGIGEAFARALAARGVDLLLTALPAEEGRLADLAVELAERHDVRCLTAAVDLAEREGPERLRAATQDLGFTADLLVNNAGVMAAGPFATAPCEAVLRVVHVNVEAVVHLNRLFLEEMTERGSGAVLTVASTAAFQPQPHLAVYAASKAFVLSLGQALWAETRGTGVRVATVCAGPVQTAARSDARAAAGSRASGRLGWRFITPAQVAQAGLDAVERDRPMTVIRMPRLGRFYAAQSLMRSMLGRRRRLRLAERVNRRLYARAAGTGAVRRSDTSQRRSASAASQLSGEDRTTLGPEK